MANPLPRLRLILGLLSAAAALRGAEATDPLRLDRAVTPVAQGVELTLDPAKDDYTGRTIIDLWAAEAFTSFRLHSQGPQITKATMVSSDGVTTTLTPRVVNERHGVVELAAAAQQGIGNYRLTLEFSARFTRDGLGLYKTVSRGDPYLFTQFEDAHARKAYPCWDEPSFKINWQLTLRVPAALEAVTNAPVAMESRDGDWKTIAFGRTPPMSSYLVAMAVGPFEHVPVPGQSVPGRIITPRGQSALAAEAARLAPSLLARLEEYFGIPYPYAKLDQIAVPEYVYGAMENPGLITYTDRGLLMDSDRPSFSARRRLAGTMAHEMAHMWFGDLVTMAWWDDLWLNESFATWISARIVEWQHPEFRSRIGQSQAIKGAMRSDALPSITAIRRKVTSETDLAQLADELTYSKGCGILTMVENWIGPAKFRAAMRVYFQRHAWGNTKATDLWAAFSETSGDDITSILSGFIERPGVPLVAIELAGGGLRLSQSRSHNLGDPELPGQWQVPVVLLWSRNGELHRERLLLKEKDQTFTVPGIADAEWIYPNAGEAGYYRWRLSPELNSRLARRSTELSSIERIGLLDNTSALFSAGLMDGNDYLAYVTAFAGDLDPDVNGNVIGTVTRLRDAYVTEQSATAYQVYRNAILRPVLKRIGLRAVPGEPESNGPLRNTLYGALGFDANDPEVVAECRRIAAQYLQDPRSADPTLLGVALRVTAHHGDAPLFDTYQAALEKARNPAARSALIATLSAFRDPALTQRALAYSLTPALNSTEFLSVVQGLGGAGGRYGTEAGGPARNEIAVDWIMTNYPAIAAKAPPEYTARLISVAANAKKETFTKLRDFLLAPERTSEGARIAVTKLSEGLAVRERLKAKEQANIEKYLATFAGRVPKD